LSEFLEILKAHGIRRLVDVRSFPRSRHTPQFNRDALARKLRSRRINYVHLKKLGGRRHPKKDSPNHGWHNASFRGFADYMQTPQFKEGLERLLKLSDMKPTAVMCAEAVPWRCHRSLIADALLVRGVTVEDIFSATLRKPHKLTPFAKVRKQSLTYPAPTPPRSRSPEKTVTEAEHRRRRTR